MHNHSSISYSYTLRSSKDRPPFGPLTAPPTGGIFPTDFSSHTPSADCLLAIADVTVDPLQVAMFFVSPTEAGFVGWSRRPTHAEALTLPAASSSGFSISQNPRFSRGTPDCFRHVTVESTQWAAAFIQEAGNWGCHVCCLLTPHPLRLYSPTGCQFVPSTLYVRPMSLRPASFNPPLRNESLPFATFHVTYPLGLD